MVSKASWILVVLMFLEFGVFSIVGKEYYFQQSSVGTCELESPCGRLADIAALIEVDGDEENVVWVMKENFGNGTGESVHFSFSSGRILFKPFEEGEWDVPYSASSAANTYWYIAAPKENTLRIVFQGFHFRIFADQANFIQLVYFHSAEFRSWKVTGENLRVLCWVIGNVFIHGFTYHQFQAVVGDVEATFYIHNVGNVTLTDINLELSEEGLFLQGDNNFPTGPVTNSRLFVSNVHLSGGNFIKFGKLFESRWEIEMQNTTFSHAGMIIRSAEPTVDIICNDLFVISPRKCPFLDHNGELTINNFQLKDVSNCTLASKVHTEFVAIISKYQSINMFIGEDLENPNLQLFRGRRFDFQNVWISGGSLKSIFSGYSLNLRVKDSYFRRLKLENFVVATTVESVSVNGSTFEFIDIEKRSHHAILFSLKSYMKIDALLFHFTNNLVSDIRSKNNPYLLEYSNTMNKGALKVKDNRFLRIYGAQSIFIHDVDLETELLIENNLFLENSHEGVGGAIHFAVSKSPILIKGNEFRQNKARTGSAVYIQDSISARLEKNEFVENAADWDGTLYIQSTKVEVFGGIFQDNIAQSSAGAISVVSSVIHFDGIYFHMNEAFVEGSAIFITKSYADDDQSMISNCEFVLHRKTPVIEISASDKIHIIGNYFYDNLQTSMAFVSCRDILIDHNSFERNEIGVIVFENDQNFNITVSNNLFQHSLLKDAVLVSHFGISNLFIYKNRFVSNYLMTTHNTPSVRSIRLGEFSRVKIQNNHFSESNPILFPPSKLDFQMEIYLRTQRFDTEVDIENNEFLGMSKIVQGLIFATKIKSSESKMLLSLFSDHSTNSSNSNAKKENQPRVNVQKNHFLSNSVPILDFSKGLDVSLLFKDNRVENNEQNEKSLLVLKGHLIDFSQNYFKGNRIGNGIPLIQLYVMRPVFPEDPFPSFSDNIFYAKSLPIVSIESNENQSRKSTNVIFRSCKIIGENLDIGDHSAIENLSNDLYVYDSLFENLGTNGYGSAVKILQRSTDSLDHRLAVNNCTFVNNFASLGGSIYIDPSSTYDREILIKGHIVVIGHCKFYKNRALQGGAIYAISYDHLNVAITDFAENEAYLGSSIYLQNDMGMGDAQLLATFKRNVAKVGGTVVLKKVSQLLYSASVFQDNVAPIYPEIGFDTNINSLSFPKISSVNINPGEKLRIRNVLAKDSNGTDVSVHYFNFTLEFVDPDHVSQLSKYNKPFLPLPLERFDDGLGIDVGFELEVGSVFQMNIIAYPRKGIFHTEPVMLQFNVTIANCRGTFQIASSSKRRCISDTRKILAVILIPLLVVIVAVFSLCVCISGYLCFCLNRRYKRKTSKYNELEMKLLDPSTQKALLEIEESFFEIDFAKDIVLEKKIGTGGSGATVFLGWYRKHQKCAIKIFKTAFAQNNSFVENFQHEVQLYASLSSRYIVQFYGCCLMKPRVGIVYEYCENGDLSSFLVNNKLSFEEKCKLLEQIVFGMIFLHEKNVIHRDLKPENVLIDKFKNAKLTDFGASKLVDTDSTNMTLRIGSREYIAPEVIRDHCYTNKCDVYSFGILMFVVYTEKTPYGDQSYNCEFKVAEDPTFRPRLPKEMVIPPHHQWYFDLMEQCWDQNPDYRPSFLEIIPHLQKYLSKYAQ